MIVQDSEGIAEFGVQQGAGDALGAQLVSDVSGLKRLGLGK